MLVTSQNLQLEFHDDLCVKERYTGTCQQDLHKVVSMPQDKIVYGSKPELLPFADSIAGVSACCDAG